MKATLDREELKLAAYDDSEKLTCVRRRITGQGRWSTYHEMIVTDGTRHYRTTYSMGSTEQQDEWPYEYSPVQVEVEVVEPREVTVTEYFAIEPATERQTRGEEK